MHITVINHLTLDGVMQAPAGADEDTRDGFEHGGWALPYQDAVIGEFMGRRMAGTQGALLFGRRTYEHMYSYWPKQTGPITDVLNRTPKYVVSTTLTAPLSWENSILLGGDDEVAALEDPAHMGILGSGELVRSLLRRDLIDELLLTIHPLVLGGGRRLFGDDGTMARFELADVTPTTTGVLITTYRRT
jgi:dihydrofolate reductase